MDCIDLNYGCLFKIKWIIQVLQAMGSRQVVEFGVVRFDRLNQINYDSEYNRCLWSLQKSSMSTSPPHNFAPASWEVTESASLRFAFRALQVLIDERKSDSCFFDELQLSLRLLARLIGSLSTCCCCSVLCSATGVESAACVAKWRPSLSITCQLNTQDAQATTDPRVTI